MRSRSGKLQASVMDSSAPGEKKGTSVHFPSDYHLERIVPPPAYPGSAHSPTTPSAASITEEGGSEVDEETKIDISSLPDVPTPGPIKLYYEPIDFSAVLGSEPGGFADELEDKHEREEQKEKPGPGNSRKKKRKGEQNTGLPEQRITLFALRLALIEKAASGIGTLAFLWATVVILGGFATTISLKEFKVVTIIIVAEGSRIFSRSHELEWHHLSSKSVGTFGSQILAQVRSLNASRRSASMSTYAKISQRFRSHRWSPGVAWPRDVSRTSSGGSTFGHRRGKLSIPALAVPASNPGPAPAVVESHKRTWSALSIPLVPVVNRFFSAQTVSAMLYVAQLVSATVSIGLSLWRLSAHKTFKEDTAVDTVAFSLIVFYVLASLEAGLFLLERVYWEYKIGHKGLLREVTKEADLGEENVDTVRQFFYDVYAECLRASVFDGLEMDLVKFGIAWLLSEDVKEQLGGARLLNRFVSKGEKPRKDDGFAEDALRRLGTTPGMLERLVEMLSWNSRREDALVLEISSIICHLVAFTRNCSRIVAVPGSMDAVVSLLVPHLSSGEDGEDAQKQATQLRLMGLRILKYLCKDHKNSLKVGETRGLLSFLTVFIEVKDESVFEPNERVPPQELKGRLKTYKKSLQVLLSLAAATNTSGGVLRKRIAAIVSGLKNLRDVIEYGQGRPELQRQSVEILYHLAMEDDVRKIIGSTGGVLRNLFALFGRYDSVTDAASPVDENLEDKRRRRERFKASEIAGNTLTRLVLQSKDNCEKLLRLKDEENGLSLVQVMVRSLNKPEIISSSAAQILRSLIRYADDITKKDIARDCKDLVANQILSRRAVTAKSEMYEASLGLAARMLEPLDTSAYLEVLKGVQKVQFVKELMRNLTHAPSTNKYPRIRRYSVELLLALIAKDKSFLHAFQRTNVDLKRVLEKTLDSISEVENFCLFSGLVGYTRHTEDMEGLVERAIKEVECYEIRWGVSQ